MLVRILAEASFDPPAKARDLVSENDGPKKCIQPAETTDDDVISISHQLIIGNYAVEHHDKTHDN